MGPFPAGFILHSYLGSGEMVPEFAKLGGYFSFSGFLMSLEAQKATKMLKTVSSSILFLPIIRKNYGLQIYRWLLYGFDFIFWQMQKILVIPIPFVGTFWKDFIGDRCTWCTTKVRTGFTVSDWWRSFHPWRAPRARGKIKHFKWSDPWWKRCISTAKRDI